MDPELMIHALAGVAGLASGATALATRKGGRAHRTAGAVFLLSMGATAASGAVLGFLATRYTDAIVGTLTVYMLLTGWLAARRRDGESGWAEIAALFVAASGAAGGYYFAFDGIAKGTAMLGGVPYLVISTIVLLTALFDLSVIVRGGLAGRQRIMRHLWRMCLGFTAAVGSFFPGQIDFFPEALQNVRPMLILFIPPFTVLGLMLFWLGYVAATRKFAEGHRALGGWRGDDLLDSEPELKGCS